MSVIVSYKKQFLLGAILLLLIIAVIEGIVRIYDYYNPNCQFIKSEVFRNVDFDLKRAICQDNDDVKWEDEPFLHLKPNQHLKTININSHGFRGQEITKEKPADVYRIFVVGGSTAFGVGSTSDSTTIPGYLQKLFDSSNTGIKIEVINAGIPKAYSYTETHYIQNNLLDYEADLFIIYDGWNDINRPYDVYHDVVDYDPNDRILRMILKNDFFKTGKVILKNYFNWKQENNKTIRNFDSTNINDKVLLWEKNWREICEIGNKKGFKIMITLQPLVGTGIKNLTNEEFGYFMKYDHANILPNYEKYANSLNNLNDTCTNTFDLRITFDNVTTTIFFDGGHIADNGNEMIAEKLYQRSMQLIKNELSNSS